MRKTIVILLIFCLSILKLVAQKDLENKIDSLINLMTLDEKVAICHAQSKFTSPGVPRLGIPEIMMSDGPHGVRAEVSWDSWEWANWTSDSVTAFPALTCLAATFNPKLSYQYGVALGEEARYRRKDIILGPGVNIYRTPLNGRNFEYMGEDPFLASVMVVPYIKGVQTQSVSACVKHYVLNNQEKWRKHVNVEVSDRALHEIYLPAFKAAAIEGKAWSLMGAYNQFRGQHACHNEILNDILKNQWQWDGVVVSDWNGTHNTIEAATNGLDIEMGTWTDGMAKTKNQAYSEYYLANPFIKALKVGDIDESYLNEKVRRILRLMYRTTLSSNRPLGRMNNKEHHQVALNIAGEGIVLLKNAQQFFPIDTNAEITIAVIGENAKRSMTEGGGSSQIKAQFEISPLEGLQKRFSKANVIYAPGYFSTIHTPYYREGEELEKTIALRKEAVDLAKKADVVIFVGGLNKNRRQDAEGEDREEYGLPYEQDQLIEALAEVNPNLGMLLVSGNAVAMPWLPKVKGLIQTWYLGSIAGDAISRVVAGDINPSGKLPYSIPVKLEDNSAHYYGESSYPGVGVADHESAEYKEGIFVGYRWHDSKNIKPQFAFGFGLSYTQFDIDAFKLESKKLTEKDTIRFSCLLKNTGQREGAEVIQLYVGKNKSKVERVKKELKGYKKVKLASHDQQNITIDIPVKKLQYYSEEARGWELEKGSYTLYVGTASNLILKKIEFSIF